MNKELTKKQKFYIERNKRFQEFLKEKDLLPFRCKCCDHEFTPLLLGHDTTITKLPVTDLDETHITGMRYYESYSFPCFNCGYMHTFLSLIIEGEVTKKNDPYNEEWN